MRLPNFHKIRKVALVVLSLATLLVLSCTSPIEHGADNDRIDVSPTRSPALDINRATALQLERLPTVGPGLAEKIIRHRERFGPFRRVEQLMLIDGISDKRFRQIRHLVTVD